MHDCICYIDAFSMEPWHLLRLISHNTHVRAIREEARRWLEIARRSTKPGFRKGKGRTGREGGGDPTSGPGRGPLFLSSTGAPADGGRGREGRDAIGDYWSERAERRNSEFNLERRGQFFYIAFIRRC
jgi:hypothetical protein